MTMRVCNVDEEGRFGGPERRIVQVARALKPMGVDTHVLYPSFDSGTFAAQLAKAGIPSTQLRITRLSKEPRILAKYTVGFVAEVFRMAAFLRRGKFDLVHVNGSYQFKTAIAARLAGIPAIWHLNDTMMNAGVKKLFPWVARYCVDGFIVAGQRVRDYYLAGSGLEDRPCLEIHAPVDTDQFTPADHEPQRMAAQPLTIVTVSGLNPTKGLEYFVEMAIRVHRKLSNVRFLVAGAELSSHRKYSAQIRQRVADSGMPPGTVKFLGLVDEVPALLRRADICVFTSISEASPTSIWEALASGKPVVTTDVGSVNAYIRDGVSGYVVPVGDVEKLADRVLMLAASNEMRAAIGAAARGVAVERLDLKAAASKHAAIYGRILNRVAAQEA